jgi:hypothetical protein
MTHLPSFIFALSSIRVTLSKKFIAIEPGDDVDDIRSARFAWG